MRTHVATFTIHEAKTNLSRLIARASAGEEIIIAKGKEPIVRLTPVTPRSPGKRGIAGSMKGIRPELPDSFFFDPLPEEELKAWEGEDETSR
jgi:prevent-host-death family protein